MEGQLIQFNGRLRNLFQLLLFFIAAAAGGTGCRQTVVQTPSSFRLSRQAETRTGYAEAISNIAPSVVRVHTRTELSEEAASALSNDPAMRRLLEKKPGSKSSDVPHALIGLGSGVVVSSDG